MSALTYWVWLSSCQSLPQSKIAALLDAFGTPENAYYADEEELRQTGVLSGDDMAALRRHPLEAAERILEQCDLASVRVLTLQDAEYPERLKNISVPPCVLYIKGRLPVIDEEPALSVVGSRRCTPYGLRMAGLLSAGLAASGMVILSGLAKGIDAAAHIAALQVGGTVIGVLGCGADVIYPAESKRLYEDVAAAGALITEYPPGTRPVGAHFPARNRIMAGLGLGVLVVEAPQGSGALITAAHALEQGRDVFAVPGNADSPECQGSNHLIKQGALLVTEPWDVLHEYAALFPHKIKPKQGPVTPLIPPERIVPHKQTLVAQRVHRPVSEPSEPVPPFDLGEAIKDFSPEGQALVLSLAGGARHVDSLVAQTGLSASQVLRELMLLELAGAVESLPGRRFALSLMQT